MSVVLRRLIFERNARVLSSVLGISRLYSQDESNIIKSAIPDVQIPDVTIPDLVQRNWDRWPNKIALECGVTGKKFSYEQVRTKSFNFNRALRKKLGLKKGDVLAVLLPNVPEYTIILFGALQAGIVVTPINPVYTAEEVSRQLRDSNAKALVALGQLWNVAFSAAFLGPKRMPIINVKLQQSEPTPQGGIDLQELTDETIDYEDALPSNTNEIALLPYSSGTTGLPKGVQLSHNNIVANICQINAPMLRIYEETTESVQDVVPSVLPIYHIYGLTGVLLNSLYQGCKVVTLPKFTPELYLSTLKKHNPQVLYVVPPIVLFLASHPAVTEKNLESVRCVVSGAAPLGSLDEERFLKKANKEVDMLQGYGLTETSPVITFVSADRKKQLGFFGSVGEAIPNTSFKIVPADDRKGKALGPNQPGELLVRGPQVMQGYLNQPEQNNEIFVDGWLRTGDMVYFDKNNMAYITDRLKELIKVKGFQVPPAELEELLRSHPYVSEAAVIGIPHSQHGEAPRAYIVPKSNTKINTDEIQEFISAKVAPYKQLKGGIELIDAIPKNASGKTMRKELKLMYEEQLNNTAVRSRI